MIFFVGFHGSRVSGFHGSRAAEIRDKENTHRRKDFHGIYRPNFIATARSNVHVTGSQWTWLQVLWGGGTCRARVARSEKVGNASQKQVTSDIALLQLNHNKKPMALEWPLS